MHILLLISHPYNSTLAFAKTVEMHTMLMLLFALERMMMTCIDWLNILKFASLKIIQL